MGTVVGDSPIVTAYMLAKGKFDAYSVIGGVSAKAAKTLRSVHDLYTKNGKLRYYGAGTADLCLQGQRATECKGR